MITGIWIVTLVLLAGIVALSLCHVGAASDAEMRRLLREREVDRERH